MFDILQFNIEDEEAGGIFYVEVKDGKLYVEPYEYYDRDAMFTASLKNKPEPWLNCQTSAAIFFDFGCEL